MAVTLAASEEGLKIFEQARTTKGWNKTVGKNSPWSECHITKATLERFHKREAIKHENFVAICSAVGIDDWEKIVARTEIVKTEEIALPESTELDIFSQQIFDWFGALDFKVEGAPRCDRNYVEAIIRVPVRSGFDRVLVQIVTHEAVLTDLDGFRQAVGDPHRQVDGGWLITKSWVSQAVKDALKESGDRRLTCLTFDELIDQDADFTPYLDWLEREIRKREIDRYYVDLGCTKGEFDADTRTLRGTSKYSVADGGIDRYIDRWLENPVTEHVSILGEFGTGKTWFAFHYAGKCLQAYREAKSKGMPRPRLPLVIPLRDYAKALNVENVLAGFFYTQHNIRLNSDVFDRLNRMGKLLLIFDGFDEMADKIDTQKMTDNFWELAKVVTTNAKVILTCRTEHFPTAHDGRENFGGERIPSTVNKIAVAPKFETLELMKFDDVQIREVLSRRTNSATVELVMANSQLLDLLRRAVMAEFVLEALPEIEAGKPIDLARVYLYAVRHKMERDITTGRTFTSLADKLYFLCELAWEMLSEDKMSINYREFPDRLRVLFKDEVKEQKHLDHWHYDMMGQTMLIRNDDGDYSPAHRSLLEFFVAYKLAAELGLLALDFLEMVQEQSAIEDDLSPQLYTWSSYWQREIDDKGNRSKIPRLAGFKSESPEKLQDTFGKKMLTKAVLDLLLPMLNWDTQNRSFMELIQFTKGKTEEQAGYIGGNAATVVVKLNPYALKYQDLSNTNLANADLVNISLRGTDLHGANLDKALITRVFGSINAIVMSKDDRQFITAHDDDTIRIWDRASGRELQKLTGHKKEVRCLALSKNGKFLYSGSGDRTIKKWNLEDSTCQKTFDSHQGWVSAIVISEDENLLYSSSADSTIKEWRMADSFCQRTFEGHKGFVRDIFMSKDGQFLYSGGNDSTIKEWRIADGCCQRTFEGHQAQYCVCSVIISADEKFLYSGSTDGTIKEWAIADGMCQQTFECSQRSLNAISLSKDGQFLYSGCGHNTIEEWRLSDGSCQRTFDGNQDIIITAITLSKDGQVLYAAGLGRTIEEWRLSDGSCQKILYGHQDYINALALSADDQLLYFGGEDGTIKEWNLDNGIHQRTFYIHQDWVNTIVISLDGQSLYSCSNDGIINKWRINDSICQRTFNGSVNTIALSKDGMFLYSGDNDGMIEEWELSNGLCKRTLGVHEDRINAISLSKDGMFLYSAGQDNMIKEWKIVDGSFHRAFNCYQRSVNSIAISANGQLLYSGGFDGTIKEWKLADGICQRTFDCHEHSVNGIALSANGQLLYSCSDDMTIKEWDLITGECLRSIDYRLCAGANITNVKGLTPAQTDSLLALGAFSDG